MKKILIVDDDIILLSQLNAYLKKEGYSTICAPDGEIGLSVFAKERPPICIIDYKMPGLDGLELLHGIKQIEPKTEVILISGNADMQVAVAAIKEHAFDFLEKPVNLKNVLKKIEEVFENIEIKKNRPDIISGKILQHRILDRPIPISEITMTMDLDETTSSLFASELEELINKKELLEHIIISLNRVNKINNMGLNVLVRMYSLATQAGYKIALSNLNTGVLKYLHTVGYSNFFLLVRSSMHPENTFLKTDAIH